MRKRIIILFSVVLFIFFGTELFLRQYYGFCDTVLIREDASYEYIAKPNQKIFRFGSNILYNSFSMRSAEIDTGSIKILGFGDSVINGGVLTDHDSLATTILSAKLSKLNNHNTQFLNISAGSWGPDNCFAYLKKNGDFHAKHLFLFVSSHDAYDNMNFEKIVGIHKSFPENNAKLAIYELWDRYLLPQIKSKFNNSTKSIDELGINKKIANSSFNTGFESFANYSRASNIPLTIYLHAEQVELAAGKYNEQGQEIIQFAKNNNLLIIKDLENGLQATDFRDNIHINEKGQRKLAALVLKYGI